MSDMLDDIEKFSKVWEKALENGIFKQEDSSPKEDNPSKDSTDFFGQYLNDEYDVDKPLNEVDTKYWNMVSNTIAANESINESAKEISNALSNAQNPIAPNSVGKDQELSVTQNWAMGGDDIESLEKLKVELYELESKLNTLAGTEETKESKIDSMQSKIDSLKTQIDKLSDSLDGGRFSGN